ncbi:alpha/beta hydrolase family protein [Psychrobacter namhaensis]|uniref:alpha/beta hydrolase family protein n=1 Tax=Psychrobacter namhaensis TaxID=292734 RepID=UPI003FD08023
MIKLKPATGTSAKPAGNTRFSASTITRPPTIRPPTMSRCLLSVAIASSLLLVGCGDDDNERFTYSTSVKSVATFDADDIDDALQDASAIGKAVTPDAKCGVTVEKISYPTKGSAGEATNATGALMLPSGTDADCQGDRPILLHAHGTATERYYDFTQVGNLDNPAGVRATLIAANFAAQGYIVVVPNYAGYDDSDLDYHPYLNAKQQSEEMVTALDTARTIIKQQQAANNANYLNVKDSGKLFLTGYSQGGHVAMATAQLLEQQNKPVTAIAPSSGPYALAAFGDAIFSGNVNIGATAFAPLLKKLTKCRGQNIPQSNRAVYQSICRYELAKHHEL